MIEAIVEELDAKHALFAELEGIVRPDAILATNTSALSVTEIASAVSTPERVVGMHFFNPAPLMPLVEIVQRGAFVRCRRRCGITPSASASASGRSAATTRRASSSTASSSRFSTTVSASWTRRGSRRRISIPR